MFESLKIAGLALLGGVFVVMPVVDFIRGELWLRQLPATFGEARLMRRAHSPLKKALRVPAHAVWYSVRYAIIAPALLVLRLFGVSQDDACVALAEKIFAGMHAQAIKFFEDDVAAAKAVNPKRPLLVVSTVSKSGTNLALFLTANILSRGDGVAFLGGDHLHSHIPWPDSKCVGMPAITLADAVAAPRRPVVVNDTVIVKTHLPINEIPYHESDKYLVVLRDPKDIVVSSHHFFAAVALGPAMYPLPALVRMFANNQHEGLDGHWANHAAAVWLVQSFRNVKLLFYEDIVREPAKTVADVAKWMGVELTEAQLARVVESISFKFMQKIGLHFDGGFGTPLSTGGEMIRSGKVGESKTALTQQQRDLIDAAMIKRLEELRSTFPYRERFMSSGGGH